MTNHLERGRAGADDNAGLKSCGRYTAGKQDAADFPARVQVGRERAGFGMQPAEVNDAPDFGADSRLGDVFGSQVLGFFEVTGRAHRVHEVVEHVDVDAGALYRGQVAKVALDDFDLVGPGHIA